MHHSPPPYVRATCPAILSSLVWSSYWYLVRSKDNEATLYAVFSTLLSRRCEHCRKPNVTTTPNLLNYILRTADCNVNITFIAHVLYVIVYSQSVIYKTVSVVGFLPCLDTVSPASYDDCLLDTGPISPCLLTPKDELLHNLHSYLANCRVRLITCVVLWDGMWG
jgi:hypothetical protein